MVLDVRVLAPKLAVCSTKADEVLIPGETGYVGVLDGHVSLVTILEEVGLLRIRVEETWIPIIVYEGVAEVDQDRVTVLAKRVQELTDQKLSDATQELERVLKEAENPEPGKPLIQTYLEIKEARCRVEGLKYLS